ncbi:hypothetical protein ACHQM5_022434 [Ranunculus cassubicifolius]
MSLSLIQSYSSTEEDDDVEQERLRVSESESDNEINNNNSEEYSPHNQSKFFKSTGSTGSLLPSAFDVFSEVAGPPEFLNNCVAEHVLAEDPIEHTSRRGPRAAGIVVEAKAQLVGIRERARSDTDGSNPSQPGTLPGGEGKRLITAANPDAKDAANLLRMCLQCGIPKTMSNARGMVCPVCGDRPPTDKDESDKRKGSMIKDKEKSKRMKGQSSHATWKSETEMQLRQQFD